MLVVKPDIKFRLRKLLLISVSALVLLALVVIIIVNQKGASAHPKGLLFPILGGGTFSNDFDSPRSNGKHNATDIFAPKGSKILAAVSGTVMAAPITQPSYGFIVSIRDAEGFTYDYIHVNNDNPGTDDGNGGPFYAYAPDIKPGAKVVRGQHIAYVGDSGNAENTPSHLHFEITQTGGAKINPYPYLLEAQRAGAPALYPAQTGEILPYGPAINALVSVAAGKFDASGNVQLATGAGPGVSPHVRILRSDESEVGGFYAYAPNFHGGVNVANGDVDGDGIDEIITGTASGAPHVRVFKTDGTLVGSFYAYAPGFTGGVNVGAVDVDADGKAEVIVGAGPGGSPHVRALKLDGSEVSGFYAYDPNFHGGVDIAGGDVIGTSAKEIVTAPGPGGGPHVRVFTTAGVPIGNGFSGYSNFTGGARVSVGNVRTATAKDEILISPWAFGSPHVRLLNGDGSVVSEAIYFDTWWNGRYDVAAGEGKSYIGTGYNRRASVRSGPS